MAECRALYSTCDGVAETITTAYGTGQVSGVIVKDKVCVRSICTKADLLAATEESDEPFSLVPFDGILGLSLPEMAVSPKFSFVAQMQSKPMLKMPVFSVFLSDSDMESSEITFGEVKDEHAASQMFWEPVSRDSGYWQVQIKDITINNKRQNLCADCQVAVDTGTSQLAGPTDVINDLSHRLNVKQDCSNYKDLPDLGFVMGDNILNLKPQDYVDKGTDGCEVSLMPLDVPPPNGPLFIFGDPFLRKYYTAYDSSQKRVGFAAARHIDMPPEAASTLLVSLNGAGDVERAPNPEGAASFLAARP